MNRFFCRFLHNQCEREKKAAEVKKIITITRMNMNDYIWLLTEARSVQIVEGVSESKFFCRKICCYNMLAV